MYSWKCLLRLKSIRCLRRRWKEVIPPTSHSLPLPCKCLSASLNCISKIIRRLYKILFHIIECLYDQNIGCDKPLEVEEIVGPLFKGEHKLSDWERILPANLKVVSSQQINAYSIEHSLHDDDY